MDEILNRLKEFRDTNYNNYPENISCKCYELSVKLLNHINHIPEVFLTYNKTVQFEFETETDYMEIEVYDDKFNIWKDSPEYGENGIEIPESSMYEVLNLIKIFFHGIPKKSILFTGAFNPPTIAHYHMIDSAIENNSFHYVIFALSNQIFLDKKQKKNKDLVSKQNEVARLCSNLTTCCEVVDYAYSERERLDMILEMTWQRDDVLIFGIEQGYTYEVLSAVKKKYNLDMLYFAMGSDKLQEINRWGYHDKLLKEFNFYVLMRGNDSKIEIIEKCKKLFPNGNYIIGEDNQSFKDISATMVRTAIKTGQDFKKLVHENVYKVLNEI